MKNIAFYTIFLFITNTSFSQVLNDKKLIAFNGYFNFYYEEAQDKIYLEVTELNKDFLYLSSLSSGIGSNDIGLDRGQLGAEKVVKFVKAGNKLLLIQPNQNFRANTDNTLEKTSVEQAFAKSVLFGFKIEEEKEGKYIIDITPFLLNDRHNVINILKSKKEGDYKLDLTKSALSLSRTKAFPKNVEFEALLTYHGEPKGKDLKSVVPDPSLVSVIQHHSFLELPDSNYEKREFDPRSGSIYMSYMDYATPIYESITKRYITRHRLEKKNPELELSEAVEPIIYYLDPGTPEPVRTALLEGASWWNEAYEAIGFKNAFQVKMLPENADPMDCRYNVIQWVHRSTRGWSYGASVIDPRTGEIIKGHVSLGSLRIRQDFMIVQALLNKPFEEHDDNYKMMLDIALARIRQLSAHEVGHTLGFTHNFAASGNNRSSVMDYPHPRLKIANDEIDFSNAYDVGIGAWDKVTVAYSYSQFNKETNEKEALNTILQKAQIDGLRFITDSDARAIGGAHAYAHLWDNGKSATQELENILEVRAKAISNFSKENIRNNESYSDLEDVFVPLYFFHRYQTEATSKLIGGLDYNYAIKGDNQLITNAVEVSVQREALNGVLKTLSAETLAIPIDKLSLFPPRAYGNERTRESFSGKTGVAFDPLSAANTASDMTFSLLLHPERLNRLIQQRSIDPNQLGLEEVFQTLIDNTFKLKYKNTYLNEIQNIVNANLLKHLMNLSINDHSFFQVKALANNAINSISRDLYDKKKAPEYATYYSRLISEFRSKPEKFKIEKSPKIPDGSPIGSYICNYKLSE